MAGYCLVVFANVVNFGVYANNVKTYAAYYNVSESTITNTEYVGLAAEMLFSLLAIKMVEWRFDYAVYSCGYLTACAYWLIYFSNHTYVIAFVGYVIITIAQLFVIQTSLYLGELWFGLEKRIFAIGIGFYSNLIGFGAGGLLTTLYVGEDPKKIETQSLILAILSTVAFLLSLILVKNKPKVPIEKIEKVSWKHAKLIWKQKYLVFNVVASSAFIGLSWSFEYTRKAILM